MFITHAWWYNADMRHQERAMHIITTRRVYKDKVYETHLLQRSYREDGKVKHETLANLSHLPADIIAGIRAQLKGEQLVPVATLFTATRSRPHGHVRAVLTAIQRLGVPELISSTPCRQRDLIVALIVARITHPDSKLATTRLWNTSTLAEELGVADANEDELYAAMDWLFERQERIEKKLAKRHLKEGGFALYDLSSSYFEGENCPLAHRGYSRDGKRGTLQVNYGLLTDAEGRPISISVYPGNTIDSCTVADQTNKLRKDFHFEDICLVGDRGMITGTQVEALHNEGTDWVTALKSGTLRTFVAEGAVQLGLFDETNLFAFTHKDFPNERLIACRNPVLGRLRAYKRDCLLRATSQELEKIQQMVSKGKLVGQDVIGVRIGRVINKYKMAKHFQLDIQDNSFIFTLNNESITSEAQMDGIYVVRTSLPIERADDAQVVRIYKSLAQVERAFRTIKGVDLLVRPIHHHLEERVRTHLFICMLAYYVIWHLKRAWADLLFIDEDLEAKLHRDPVAPAQRSAAAQAKVNLNRLPDDTAPHSFQTLLAELATICRIEMSRNEGPEAGLSYEVETVPTELQRKVFERTAMITV